MATTTTSTQDIPVTLQPYANALLSNAFNYANPNATPYYGLGTYYGETGQTPFAQFNPLQMQAAGEAQTLGPSSYLGQGANLAGMGGLGSLNLGQNYLGAASNPFTVGAYMSPYMQNVVDTQKQQAISDYGRQLPTLGASAAKFGGLGGTRSALMQSEAQRNLGNRLSDIQATGSQSAFQNAQDILNRGAQFGLQGYGQGIQAGNALSNIGSNQFNQALQGLQQRWSMGKDIYGTEADVANRKFADYQAMMNNPLTQMNFLSGILSKVPTGSFQQPTTSNNTADVLGGLGSLYSIYKSFNP